MLLFIVSPIGYGWGYRGWGPPYPSYIQRQRAQRAQVENARANFNHHSWSWGGDLMWIMGSLWIGWAIMLFWWR